MGKQEMKARDTSKRHAQDAQARENCKRHTRGRIVHCLWVQTVVSRKEMLQYGQKGETNEVSEPFLHQTSMGNTWEDISILIFALEDN